MDSKLRITARIAGAGFRLPTAALAVAIAFAGSASTVAVAATVPAAATTCTDNWVGPASGTANWATSADWSAGVPNGSTVACIKKAGSYTVQATTPGEAAAAVQVGGAASGTQTLQIDGVNFSITQPSEVLKGGVLSLTPTSSSGAAISATGTTISLTIAAGGTLSSAGTANAAVIGTPLLVNKGTVTLAAASNNDDAGTTTDAGSFTVASGSTFTSSSTDFTHSAGKLTVHGTFNGENTFTQSGGTETGNPVTLPNGTLTDSAGTGSFTFTGTADVMTGTVPAGQTVTTRDNLQVGTSTTPVTVDGTLACEPQSTFSCDFSTAGNDTWPGITVAPGGTVSTTGPGNPADDVFANLDANMDVKAGGTLTIANPATTVNAATLTNSGTWQVTATGNITIGGNCAVDSTGTLGVTVGSKVTAPDGTIDTTNISGFTATGTLAVDTLGSEGGGAVITTRGGLAAAFSKFSFGPDYYTVTSSTTEVELTAAVPFTASATAFSPVENEPITPKVASFTTHGEPGTYTATVNYGDGSGTQPATVNLSGGHGTVTGTTHTYTATGTYTVTVVISTTAGTTKKVSEKVTVTGP
jgi:fibronectin-binding autotransporter adhesin